MTASNVAALPTGKGQFSLTPQSLDEALRFADMLSKSSIVPKDYQGNPGNVIVAIQWGAELGLPPLQAMQNIAVINGRPSIWGDAVLAIVRASGLLVSITEELHDDSATCTVQRRGEDPVTRTFSTEDAKKAGLFGKQGPWQQYPKRMLQMRARGFALRDVFPDVLRGVYVAEEAQDLPPERDMGPVDQVETQKPATRADAVRKAISDRRSDAVTVPPVTAGPALADVLQAISSATTFDALQSTAKLAEHLDDDGKAKARAAFKARRDDLSQQPVTDADGVIIDPGQADALEPPPFTFAKFLDLARAAKTLDEVDELASLITAYPRDQQPELSDEIGRARKRIAGSTKK